MGRRLLPSSDFREESNKSFFDSSSPASASLARELGCLDGFGIIMQRELFDKQTLQFALYVPVCIGLTDHAPCVLCLTLLPHLNQSPLVEKY